MASASSSTSGASLRKLKGDVKALGKELFIQLNALFDSDPIMYQTFPLSDIPD
jgi:hypothetical protein